MSTIPSPPKTVTFTKTTRRGPGRPRKVEVLPKNDLVAQIQKLRDDHISQDKLLNKLGESPNSLDILDQLMLDLALEAAALDFEKSEAERKGKDTSSLSSRKITALKSLADLYFRKRDAILDQSFDFRSHRFEKFMEWMLMKVFRKSAEEAALSGEQISILFDHIAKKFEDNKWEKEALAYIKSD